MEKEAGLCRPRVRLGIRPCASLRGGSGRAGDKTDAGPCDDLVAYVREALAGPVPDITRDRGPGYRDQEGNIEGRLSSTWHTQPRSYRVRVTPACRGSLEIDPAVVAAANVMGTPELYEALLPVLAMARAHQALGYDRLRDAVCAGEGAMSDERARACATRPRTPKTNGGTAGERAAC